ncbi:hypothetical protein [Shinella sp. HZN7]|uniref:hypothetical protein n=1 Tax=Shinella sp. (strain HZN7) TaxID=879274 RepID=UPI0007DA88E8|nr:hypothetical protein [Shinella sp. HZN7]ANH04437.1 hypothetical protein shn_10540 [Shinella sp. HZN7]
MGIIAKLLKQWMRFRRRQAEREALRLLVARRDIRLLRDVGLTLVEGSERGYALLPQVRERRWTAPLIRLPPPSPRRRGDGDAAPASASNIHNVKEKPAA